MNGIKCKSGFILVIMDLFLNVLAAMGNPGHPGHGVNPYNAARTVNPGKCICYIVLCFVVLFCAEI